MGFAGKFSEEPYLEQFERVKRWHEILNNFRYSNADERETNYQIDCIYVFFINCFHLKDWLIHSGKISNADVNQFINSHKELMICRDICNASKHLSLTTPSIENTTGCTCGHHGVYIHREYDPEGKMYSDIPGKCPIKNITYNIFVEYEKINVFKVADKCVDLWIDLLDTLSHRS